MVLEDIVAVLEDCVVDLVEACRRGDDTSDSILQRIIKSK